MAKKRGDEVTGPSKVGTILCVLVFGSVLVSDLDLFDI